MPCSPEQKASNARNAQLSTGPKTTSGKQQVRGNALKHGLTGAGIAVLDEDVAVIESRFVEFNADYNPLGVISEFLMRYLVLQSVKMDRAARQEAAAINRTMLQARQAAEARARLEFRAQLDRLADEPEAACRELERSPRGIEWMIASWEKLKATLNDPDPRRWELAEAELAENLSGRRLVSPESSRIVALSCAYHGHFGKFRDWPDLSPAERSAAARAELAGVIDAEIGRLQVVLANFDHDARAKEQADALALLLFDASKEAQLARKYAAAAERAFFKTLKTIQELNAAARAKAVSEVQDASLELEKVSEELALNWSSAGADSPEVKPGGFPPDPGPSEGRKPVPDRSRRAEKRGPHPLRE